VRNRPRESVCASPSALENEREEGGRGDEAARARVGGEDGGAVITGERASEKRRAAAVEQEGKDQCRLPGQPRHLIFLPSWGASASPTSDPRAPRRRRRGSKGHRRAGGFAKDPRERRDPRENSRFWSPPPLSSLPPRPILSATRERETVSTYVDAVGLDTNSAWFPVRL